MTHGRRGDSCTDSIDYYSTAQHGTGWPSEALEALFMKATLLERQ